LAEQAAAALAAEGFAPSARRFLRSADLRYRGQAFEVRVAAPDGAVDAAFAAAVAERFHDAHERLYGYCFREDPRQRVEWVNLRVTGVGPIRRPALPASPPARRRARRARPHRRSAGVLRRAGGARPGLLAPPARPRRRRRRAGCRGGVRLHPAPAPRLPRPRRQPREPCGDPIRRALTTDRGSDRVEVERAQSAAPGSHRRPHGHDYGVDGGR
jgi:hypothetical protein